MATGGVHPGWSCLQGKEIIEYYLRQLEEEGITFVPRWTPPPTAPASELPPPCKQQPAVSTVAPVETGQKEGPVSEAVSNPSGAPEPLGGTPDGGSRALISAWLTHVLLLP